MRTAKRLGRSRFMLRRPRSYLFAAMVGVAATASCFDKGTRWEDLVEPPVVTTPECVVGEVRCASGLQRCVDGSPGPQWALEEDCKAQGLVCSPTLGRCASCEPAALSCDGQTITRCRDDGNGEDRGATCEPSTGQACRAGSCVNLCEDAGAKRSNVGCEYWAVDLDNAVIDATSNAAAQQFAVVVSNPQPDVPADVSIYQDDGAVGDPSAPRIVARATIAPRGLQVFKLGPREVDGSAEGTFNRGTHSALGRQAYRLNTTFPVVAYQFSPLENANVFSNDASLLKPSESFNSSAGSLAPAYVVVGWPQTIAITDDPATNFDPSNPINLRAFLTIVGTRGETKVRVKTRAAIVAGGPIGATAVGGIVEATLGPFDVLNLETGSFNADFTGSIIYADGPIAVFSGSEASDAPHFSTLANRRCCADHLEEQLDPLRTAGRSFALAHSPSRTKAVKLAGATLGVVDEPEYFRFVNASSQPATITTTLPAPLDTFTLSGLGDFREVTSTKSFMASSSGPIHVGQVLASQEAASIPRGLPGGDPSLIVVPPIEQYRADYVFLTPDKYAFDFLSIIAPPDALVLLDDAPVDAERCDVSPADGLTAAQRGSATPPLVVYECQLSFPVIDPSKAAPDNISLGVQNDGVHRILASVPIGVIVSGFDNFVSYAYAAGTELREIAPPQ